MNYKQALIGKPHAAGVMKVLEGLEWECSRCKGKGRLDALGFSFPKLELRCDRCNGKTTVKYTWTPQVGEWVLCLKSNKVHLVSRIFPKYRSCIGVDHIKILQLDAITPILGWEEIVRLVEKATKYSFEVIIPSKRTGRKAQCLIFKPWVRRGIKLNGVIVDERADSTQVAVMKAVRWLKEVK